MYQEENDRININGKNNMQTKKGKQKKTKIIESNVNYEDTNEYPEIDLNVLSKN